MPQNQNALKSTITNVQCTIVNVDKNKNVQLEMYNQKCTIRNVQVEMYNVQLYIKGKMISKCTKCQLQKY